MENDLRKMLRDAFIRKDELARKDITTYTDHIKAALVTTASEMSKATDFVFDDKEDKLVDVLLGLVEDPEGKVKELTDYMDPGTVKALIGFSIDFRDYGHAKAYYETARTELDNLYWGLDSLIERERSR